MKATDDMQRATDNDTITVEEFAGQLDLETACTTVEYARTKSVIGVMRKTG